MHFKPGDRLDREFYTRDVLEVAPDLIGKYLAFRSGENSVGKYVITEVEAYRGEEDRACHAWRGKTSRTRVMYQHGGLVYVYFIYGMYWMLNIVTEKENIPHAVLIRGIDGFNGPGKITRALGIDKSFYGEDLTVSERIWIEESGLNPKIKTSPRIGVDYAGEWRDKPWRFFALPSLAPGLLPQ